MPDYSPADIDLVARTALAEGGVDGPQGIAGVANVVRNRLQSGEFGSSVQSVVRQPNAFTAWSLDPRDKNYPGAISPRDANYQQAYQIAHDVLSGNGDDPTKGATYYYNPKLQAAQGRDAPAFAVDTPVAVIGRHRFYAPQDTDDVLGAWGAAPKNQKGQPSKADPHQAEDDLLGAWTPKADKQTGSTNTPAQEVVARFPAADETSGEFVNREMAGHQGNSWGDLAARLGLSAYRGVGDVSDTVWQGLSPLVARGIAAANGFSPEQTNTLTDYMSGTVARNRAASMAFDNAAANFPSAQVGRLGGQVLGTLPALYGAGEVAAPALTAMGPFAGTVAGGAGAGALSSALTSSASDEPLSTQVGTGAAVGGALGPLGYGASALGRGVRNLLFGSLDPATARLAQAGGAHGIDIGPGELSSTEMVRRASSLLQRFPFSGYGGRTAENQGAFNRAIAQTFGEDADHVTTQTIANARDRIGDAFEDVARRTGNIAADHTFHQSVGQILTDARSVLPESEFAPLRNQVNDIYSAIDPHSQTFSADTYQALTRKGAPLDRAMQSKDPNIRFYAGQMRDALDDAMQRSAPPDVVQDLIQARSQWKAMKTVEPLAKKATTGDISPALLLGAVNKSYRGDGGDLGELGRIGQRFLKPQGTSGTAEHLALLHLPSLALGALGVGGAYEFDPEHFQRDMALLGAAGLTGRVGSAALRSNMLARGMINNALGARGGQPVANLLARTAPLAALTYRPANSSPSQ